MLAWNRNRLGAAIPSGWKAQKLAEMFAAAILEAIDSATKPLGKLCLCQGLKNNFSLLINQEDEAAAAEDKVAAARNSFTSPKL